ncbi:hypothetical protein L6164_022937 [Bauhinia variegata]|uniref:Uncharacterized protein n=1 Tax=Bauhinia variegata TaxID=167791 RepID=A0ACB9MGQ1_BAUVA|nr:hypothetical protein L6164_022937 [Bauhinia variegata]
MGNVSSASNTATLPIDTRFNLPAGIPVWPQGDGFAKGIVDLGELQVSQISTFNKVWSSLEGGPGNAGATIFEPTGIPEGFSMLGCYSQANNKALFGWVLVAKDVSNGALKAPVDYTLVWSSQNLKIKQDKVGYVWLPTAPDGYKAVGHVVTTTPDKPSLDKIRCVRSDLTDECQKSSWIWGPGSSSDPNGFNIHDIRPINRGIQAPGVVVGTFLAQNGTTTSPLSISCLKNPTLKLSSMPTIAQIEAIVQVYSPFLYLHPNESYVPASLNWYFTNGALLYTKGQESSPVPIKPPNGSNLPQGGGNDGAYWVDLPADKANRDRVIKGDLQSCQSYLQVKPMFGGTFTDIVMWVFYPFNGPATAKAGLINIPLGRIGEHVGDWEHVTLRVSNFSGELWRVYMSQHSGGQWVNASELEFQSGNKSVIYSSLNGHALYPKAGTVMQGTSVIGIRNDTAKSNKVFDMGKVFEIVSAEYLGSVIAEPPWLNFLRQWGPTISYDIAEELEKVMSWLPGNLKSAWQDFVDSLPDELLGQQGPTGPKLKRNWSGDEV